MTRKRTSSPSVVDLTDLPTWAIECREYGHAPRFVTDRVLSRRGQNISVIEREMRCLGDCKTHWFLTMKVPSMEVLKRAVDYDKGYLLKGRPRATRQEVRQMTWKRPKIDRRQQTA